MGSKYDKEVHFGQSGLSGSGLRARDPIRVDQFATLGRAMIVSVKQDGGDLTLRLKLRRTEAIFFYLDLIFDTTGFDLATLTSRFRCLERS